jgi:homoserine dehydrogenase
MVSVLGTTGTGFLQDDACWRELERLPPGELSTPYYIHAEVNDRVGVLATVARQFAVEGVSIARLEQQILNGSAALDIVTHAAPAGRVDAALDAIAELPEVRSRPEAMRVIAERGV